MEGNTEERTGAKNAGTFACCCCLFTYLIISMQHEDLRLGVWQMCLVLMMGMWSELSINSHHCRLGACIHMHMWWNHEKKKENKRHSSCAWISTIVFTRPETHTKVTHVCHARRPGVTEPEMLMKTKQCVWYMYLSACLLFCCFATVQCQSHILLYVGFSWTPKPFTLATGSSCPLIFNSHSVDSVWTFVWSLHPGRTTFCRSHMLPWQL